MTTRHNVPDDKLSALQAENARLIALLEAHGIAWRISPPAAEVGSRVTNPPRSAAEKVALFARRFRGRTDVYPLRWESKTTGKSGYAPACGNEWRAGVCAKPRIKCGDCPHRRLLPLSDAVLYDHLAGRHTIGVYPLLPDDSCHFLAVDFDEADWCDDARAFLQSCQTLGIPAAVEISRSGAGAHVWIFFTHPVPARDARRLGTAIISYTCARTRQLKLRSYDRLFPHQDTLPKGGFGNLIALPLQKYPREQGRSVFVDEHFQPYPDQWAFLAALDTLGAAELEAAIFQATGDHHPLDVTFIDDEDLATPWQVAPQLAKLSDALPESLTVTLANKIYIDKASLPQTLSNRLIRLAAFQNPEFYQAQAMRLSVWKIPRVIGCAENYPRHIALPRGCLEALRHLLQENGIRCDWRDERFNGDAITISFRGTLRADQAQAVDAILPHECGILCAPTAFGKTVTAAAIIARRRVNTLILVHRKELLKQWQARLSEFLAMDKDSIGCIGGGKAKPGGKIDIAVMQSLSRQGEVNPLVQQYGQVIVDECHHIGAVSFDAILKQVKAKYVLGLTATPIRRDGQQPIIFMQCGPIRHTAASPAGAPQDLQVHARLRPTPIALPPESGIQDVLRHLAQDAARTQAIAAEVQQLFAQQHNILVLSERSEHLHALHAALHALDIEPFLLHGRLSGKTRTALMTTLEALPPDAPRILLATGKLIGEGFDHPPLDTLVLAMPISWKGTLQQYAGRLHRSHPGKETVRIIDFVDTGHPALLRMWQKRQRAYRAMGYSLIAEAL